MNIKKALVVDDSKVAHLTLRKLLLERGVEVDWVGSGEECIKYLGVRKPAAIFMDVMMPGMDGFETTRVITSQKLQGPPPIIMCSANATDEDKRDAQESGAIGFLSKPYTPEQLDDVLRLVSQAAASPVEKGAAPTAPVAPPPVVATQESQPASAAAPPVPKTPTVAPAAAQTAEVSASEIEQIAERAAWAAAEKVARDIIQELVPSLARETAMQAARGVSEDLGRRSAHAAVRAAQEAAKQVATEIARSAAERTARSTAQESARSVAEQAARQISEGVSQRSVARGLELNRDELLAEIEQKVGKKIRETLGIITGAPDFKQQILQMVRSNIQPVIETIARETAERTVQQEAANLGASGGAGRATMALALAAVAFIGSMVALGRIFGLF